MKIMKKLAMLMLSVCLVLPCFGILAYAADGTIMFSDPSTSTGEVVEVTGVVKAGAAIGDADLNLTYDSEYLRFKSGDNVTESSTGQLAYAGKGTGRETELRFKMQFDVLKEGKTKIEVASYKAYLFSDEKLNCQQGSSTVTIAKGAEAPAQENPSEGAATGVKVLVGETEYTLSEGFKETEIPSGFAPATMEYDGAQRKVVKQETSETYLAYLVDAENNGRFFLYQPENATFAPFEQIQVSETAAIVLLSDRESTKLPEEYKETSIAVNGFDFPAWKSTEQGDYYLLYAVNPQGEKSLYRYDSLEGTYQRFEAPKVEKEKKSDSFIGKLTASMEQYMDYVVLGAMILFVILIVLLIMLSVKLHNRNAELDELYDEYGIDEEEEPVKVMEKSDKKSKFKRPEKQADFEEDFQVSLSEDDYDEDDYGEDDDFEDVDDYDYDDYDEYDDYGDDDFEDEPEEEPEPRPVMKRQPRKETFEDFDLDFIDLDD